MTKGYLCLVLHAHLPFIRHPEFEDFLEEDWLYEAITETYIPLLLVMERLEREGVNFRLTMSITPPLAGMLTDPLLQKRYSKYLSNLESFAGKEKFRMKNNPQFKPALELYRNRFSACRKIYARYGGDILKGFKHFQDRGFLEIITCTGTHGFLPLMVSRNNQRAQVRMAVSDYAAKFGKKPKGIWLAECGYTEGADEILAENGIRYFFTDTHGILFGRPRPKYAVYAPVFCPSGVAVFARDVESSMQVWSAEAGYPGDYRYREFYRDVGYDLPYDYIKPHLHRDGVRRNVGIKYYRITGRVPLNKKEPYDPAAAGEAALTHARHFIFCRERQCEYLNSVMDRNPIVVCPYDAELYGHWWWEGPEFLYFLFRELAKQDTVKPVTPSWYLRKFPQLQVLEPCPSTWGDRGFNEVWLNGTNDWVYRHLYYAGEKMALMAKKFPDAKGIKKKILNQMARELMLSESSDWAFIMTAGTTVPYAHKRTKTHLNNFLTLLKMLENDKADGNFLKMCEERNNIFPQMDYKIYG